MTLDTETVVARERLWYEWGAAAVGTGGLLFLAFAAVLVAAVHPRWDVSVDGIPYISHGGAQSNARAAMFAVAAGVVAGMYLMWVDAARALRVLGIPAGLALLGVAIVPLDTERTLHAVLAAIFFTASALWAVLLAIECHHYHQHQAEGGHPWLRGVALTVLAGAVVLALVAALVAIAPSARRAAGAWILPLAEWIAAAALSTFVLSFAPQKPPSDDEEKELHPMPVRRPDSGNNFLHGADRSEGGVAVGRGPYYPARM